MQRNPEHSERESLSDASASQVQGSLPLRLTYAPFIERDGVHVDRFTVRLDGEVVIKATRSPLYAGARALLACGCDPSRLMTVRLADRAYDSFAPAPIGELARWTIVEGDRSGMQRRKWSPFPTGGVQGGRGGGASGDGSPLGGIAA